MLSISDPAVSRTRRELLRIGGLSALGVGLPTLLGNNSAAHAATTGFGKAKACILLWMSGGAPQLDTFDPKPDAPKEIRGELGSIATRTPGVRFGELLPRLANLSDRLLLLRAVSTNNYIHSPSGYWMLTGYEHPLQAVEVAGTFSPNDHPCFGGVVRKLLQDDTGLPASVSLPEPITNNPRVVWPGQNAGFLGRACDPWLLECDPSSPSFGVPQLTLPAEIPTPRLQERRRLLSQLAPALDAAQRSAERDPRLLHYRQALALLGDPRARRAFELTEEAPAVREAYGPHKFGQSCLLARRLVEAGVRLVQVNWPREPGDSNSGNPVWDTHRDNAGRMRKNLAPPMDQAVAALLTDLDQRGLLDETLVVWMGEFGRSPQINVYGGREHWGGVFTVALAGAGVRAGVHGRSDKFAGLPADGRVLPSDLAATIYHLLGIDPDRELADVLNRPLPVSRGTPLTSWMS